jgi:hypothetical protein
MRKIPISYKSFERTAFRFLNLAEREVDSWSNDEAFKERFDSEVLYLIEKSVGKLIKNYKSKSFKVKSAITSRVECFKGVDGVIRDIRVSYTISDGILVFKLLTRVSSRFKRRCQFVLKIN